MKILVVVILILYIGLTFANPPNCGTFGLEYDNEKCLCAAYTTPKHHGMVCANGTGICTPPSESFVGQNERYTLKLTAKSLNFVGQNLEIVLEFPAIPTGYTDITVYTKKGEPISSLGDFIANTTLGHWSYRLDDTGVACTQVVKWVVNWRELAHKVKLKKKGHYAFDLTASTHITREKSRLNIRSTEVAPSILIDVVPVRINLNEIVITPDFKDRVELKLDYDVKLNYFLKKVHLDPTTLKMRVILDHGITFPLSLGSQNLVVSINGDPVPSRSYEKENKQDCPAKKGSICNSKTIILFSLPLQTNCTEYQLTIDVDLAAKCHGVNDHTSKYLCYGLLKSLSQQTVHLNLPIKYNFCPKIETTEVSVKTFTLTQNNDVLKNEEILLRDLPLNGVIQLNVDRIFQGSVFTSAKISSISLIESSANPASYDITEIATRNDGEMSDPQTITISFSYSPSYQQITQNLQNWANGFFIQVTIDVSFYSPEGLQKRNGGNPLIPTTVRLQIPHPHPNHNNGLPNYMKRDHVVASSADLKLNEDAVKKSIEEHKLVQQKIKTEKLSEDLKVIQKNNEQMVYLIVASIAGCFIVLMIAGILIYKLRKGSQQSIQN